MPALKARARRAAVLIPAALALVPATADADSLRMTVTADFAGT